MNISILQYANFWKNPQENLTYIAKQLPLLPKATDLVILTEMFTTGVSTDVQEIAETMSGETIQNLKQMSSKYNIAICGSMLIQEENRYYNRFVFVKPDGEINTYDKRHRFTMGGEHHVIEAGQRCDIIEYKGWRIKPQVCYDLRFPVWSRNTENYDLLIYVSNWPKTRNLAYETLLRARAIENQCYVCACNRTGVDGNKIVYDGRSQIIDAKGQLLVKGENTPETLSYELSKEKLNVFRSKFPVLEDGDTFEIK